MTERQALEKTFYDRVTVTRAGTAVYEALPCALSKPPQTRSPRLRGEWEGMAESGFALTLYLPCGTVLLAGDRAEVTREGQVFRGMCSASLPYPTHAIATLDVQEVTAV